MTGVCTWNSTESPRAVGRPHWLAGLLAGVALLPWVAAQSVHAAEVTLEQVFPKQRFLRPLQLVAVPDGSKRVVVVEQNGDAMWFSLPDGAGMGTLIDLRQRVSTANNEEGLLSLAFDPAFTENGHVFVYYSAASPRRSVIARYTADRTNLRANPATALTVLEVKQPYGNHNGGQLAFGPDGYLYVGLGDGGSAGDPHGHGQNRKTLLGSILRIDARGATVSQPYRVPPDNPFVNAGDGSRPEIWAYGLRNPWRFSFDRETGALIAGDVGQSALEEISRIEKGGNYGWNRMEGSRCYAPPSGCDTKGLAMPIAVYGRGEGISVTGGFVYRGLEIPSLTGRYLFADFGSGMIWTIPGDATGIAKHDPLIKTGLLLSSFGEDMDGELYVTDLRGAVYRLAAGN